jgi:hypothetical protein
VRQLTGPFSSRGKPTVEVKDEIFSDGFERGSVESWSGAAEEESQRGAPR